MKQSGRPKGESEVREKLIFHARELFVSMPYNKVSTRLIATNANVNIAMIRYYFGNKEGLFEAMFKETIAPVTLKFQRLLKDDTEQDLVGLMRAYYKTMIKVPAFPKLILRIMDAESEQQAKLQQIIIGILQPMQNKLFDPQKSKALFKNDVDPIKARLSLMSLMIFPFLAPKKMLELHNIELNETFLMELLEHNIRLLSEGLLKNKRDTDNENE
ncbi:TetR/AcrR family transcriptional regulator [Aliivibrio fischeri]|uniref:TetR/AcrR family transcriptional regulator n=1 Tax=Aliivibrio fischeri TaxID=668 RepID=UPI0012DADD47|nr:TetR/AcrR family transcriptional regulator [Aliivibrio fischeri]MUK68791.1 TetR family transcriptional regulator [Aliivibrio fischeri]MUK72161.1 TetR family transcriptional regulator [Aliivibrio fischeri]